jgi:hypothetical protein
MAASAIQPRDNDDPRSNATIRRRAIRRAPARSGWRPRDQAGARAIRLAPRDQAGAHAIRLAPARSGWRPRDQAGARAIRLAPARSGWRRAERVVFAMRPPPNGGCRK